jgi:hypothetical protein
MIKVSVEVREGTACFRVGVRAASIARAVSIVRSDHPDRDVRVVFPIDPDGFFVGEDAARGGSRKRLFCPRVS